MRAWKLRGDGFNFEGPHFLLLSCSVLVDQGPRDRHMRYWRRTIVRRRRRNGGDSSPVFVESALLETMSVFLLVRPREVFMGPLPHDDGTSCRSLDRSEWLLTQRLRKMLLNGVRPSDDIPRAKDMSEFSLARLGCVSIRSRLAAV